MGHLHGIDPSLQFNGLGQLRLTWGQIDGVTIDKKVEFAADGPRALQDKTQGHGLLRSSASRCHQAFEDHLTIVTIGQGQDVNGNTIGGRHLGSPAKITGGLIALSSQD